MTWLKRWWAALLVPLGLVVGVAVWRATEDIKNGVTAYAAIVATVSALFTIQKQYREDEEKKEVLKATVKYRDYDPGEWVLVVYNPGKAVVPIQSVNLVIDRDQRKRSIPMTCFDRANNAINIPNYRLEHKKHIDYQLDSPDEISTEEILSLPPEGLHIVVESYSGSEVVKVTGKEIQDGIRAGMGR
ncbi:hypothetical protein R5W24_003330 [Gemmata sp. JC717]|uniref:hypothetical protein n=1 Tax=Gemmata algarum TaxID=2975278 RepID=UPI0021BB26E1|nr:hypothetical protein [Gemmata algarum]MDY3554211.1 hypothetical protein [Gemmata algarum]